MDRAVHHRARRRAGSGAGVATPVISLLIFLFAVTTVFALRNKSGEPVLGNQKSSVLLAWTSGGVAPTLAAGAAKLPGVKAATEIRNGMGWLTSWAAEGANPPAPEGGFRTPIEIAAIDPAGYSRMVPEDQREIFGQLTQGGALLSRSGAALRGITDKGRLVFGEMTVPVVGVVDDNLVASHEAVMSRQTAAPLGISEPRYVLIAPKNGTSREQIRSALSEQLKNNKRLGLRSLEEAPVLRPGGAILPQAQMKKLFGEFGAQPGKGAALAIDPRWIQANTANATVPLLGVVRCNKKIIPAMKGAFAEIVDKELSSLVRKNDFGGCFAPRNLNSDPQSGISRHAWGAAFDFNVSRNLLGRKPAMDQRVVEIMRRWGFAWGGDWMEPDGMHFEYLKAPAVKG